MIDSDIDNIYMSLLPSLSLSLSLNLLIIKIDI